MNMSTKKENKYNIIQLIVVVIIIGIVAAYTFMSQKQIRNYAEYAVEQNAGEISEEIDSYIGNALDSVQLISHLATQYMSGPVMEDAQEVMELLTHQTPFEYIDYIDSKGSKLTQRDGNSDVSDCRYYIDGMNGNTGISIDYHTEGTDGYLLHFYTPVYYKETVAGVLDGVVPVNKKMGQILHTSFFGEETTGMLCDEDGQVIAITSRRIPDCTLDDLLNIIGVTKEERGLFYERTDDTNGRVFTFSGKQGRAIACVSVNEQTGWRVIQIVPPETFRKIMRRNAANGYWAELLIIMLFSACLLYRKISSRAEQRKLIEENQKAIHDYEQILTATVADTSKGIRRVDLDTEDTDYIYFENNCLKQKKLGNWTDWFARQEQFVYPKDYRSIAQFFSIEHLRAMVPGITYRTNYRAAQKNADDDFTTYTTTASLIAVEGKKTAIITTIDSTEAVSAERERKLLLASAASIYISMHVFDLKNDSMEALQCEEHVANLIAGRRSHVQELLREVMSKMTDEQYMQQVYEFIDFDTLDERMLGTNTITLEFIGKTSGWCRARFIIVDYDRSHKIRHVLWMVENIDAEKRRANHLLYLSETDLMTGIRNRGSGETRIRELLADGHEGTFCVMDVDEFKMINDNFGHETGDQVLIAIAGCLKESFRDADVVMRLGGDEFAVFMDGVTDNRIAAREIEAFFERMRQTKRLQFGEHTIAVSLGAAATKPDDEHDFETLYRNADSCTYKSKKVPGSAYTFFE